MRIPAGLCQLVQAPPTLSILNIKLKNKNIMKNQTSVSKSNSQPVHKIRHGAVSASIWCQETEKGPMFNVTFQRAYKEGDVWKNSTSFGRNNLLVVSLIAARAFEWIGSQPRPPKR
jgi:hypothetical protein